MAAAALVAGLLSPGAAQAQTAENVAVVINENSAASVLVGEHYVVARGIPASNVLRIRTSTEDAIDRDAFVSSIQQPLSVALAREGLHDRVLYLVLTKGIPLRIDGTSGREGTMSSVDSELTLLYRRMTGRPVPVAGPLPNPYFLGDREVAEADRFTRRAHDIYLVSRLDAFTPVEAIDLVDKSMRPAAAGRIVLHQRGSLAASAVADGWLVTASKTLAAQGHAARVLLDTAQSTPAVDAVLGYYSWGSADPLLRQRQYGLRFVPGALAATFVGTSARTFTAPSPDWVPTESGSRAAWFAGAPQSLLGDLIREGATGAAGYIAEPYLQAAVRPQILFPAYLAGFNLVEAFYLAMPALSWQAVVVGDPLCAPFTRAPVARGDIDEGIDRRTELPAFFSARRLEAAEASLDAPAAAVAQILRADVRRLRGDLPGVREALAAASREAPALPMLHQQLALLAQQAGDHDEAIARYRRVLALQPDDVIALNNLAHALATSRRAPAEARPLAERAVTLSNRAPAVVDTLGWIEHLLANHADAARLVREAAAGAPGVASIRLNAAFVLAEAGEREEAEAHLAAALRLNPSLVERTDVRDLRVQITGATR